MDDLLELDFNASASSSKSAQPTGIGRTTFDYLSSARAGSPHSSLPSRANSPYLAPASTYGSTIQSSSNGASRSQTMAKLSSGTTSNGSNSSAGGDAFSSLFGASSSTSNGGNLSMAERLAKENGSGNGWTGMSPSHSGSNISRSSSPQLHRTAVPPPPRPSNPSQSNWNFDLLANAVPSPSLSAKSPSIPSKSQSSSNDFFSFDELVSSTVDKGEDDFGFGPIAAKPKHRDYEEAEGEDFMGLLSQPVSSIPRQEVKPVTQQSSPSSNPRSHSPPPHILGQIVEMGFSIQQAQSALAATIKPNGQWNIEGALEILVSRSGEEEPRAPPREEQYRPPSPPAKPARPVGRRAREAAALAAENAEKATSVYQEQATVLLNQASKIGFSVFKSAGAYYKTGRATLQKALEEGMDSDGARRSNGREGNSPSRSRDETRNGRPKWMTDDVMDDDEPKLKGESQGSPSKGKESETVIASFMDSDGEEDSVMPQRPTNGKEVERNRSPPKQSSSTIPRVTPINSYPSPRRTESPSLSNQPTASTSKPVIASKPPPLAKSATPPRPARHIIFATQSQLSTSTAAKVKGSDLFKLGHFGEAVSNYTIAIDSLPSGHLALIVLYNNRASARMKIGEEKGAIEDATAVIKIVKGSSDRIDFLTLGGELEGVNLKEGVAKALIRRAKASEVEEKWSNAAEDWTLLMSGDEEVCRIVGGRKVISDGIGRCRKMLSNPSSSQPAPSKPPIRSPPVSTKAPAPSSASGEALAKLREANSVASAEDELRFALKDKIETALVAWKGGKETNLRALIASLDNILWKELGWVKVGMHELISESQLKIRYMRAISKVHPDKLTTETTVEHRMIADGVFATLNSAWNAQRAG